MIFGFFNFKKYYRFIGNYAYGKFGKIKMNVMNSDWGNSFEKTPRMTRIKA